MDIPRAYLLGYHLGDGSLHSGPRKSRAVSYTDSDEDVLHLIQAILMCEFGSYVRCARDCGDKNAFKIVSTKRIVCEWIDRWVGAEKRWPCEVWEWKTEAKKAFLIGLMDSDGFVGIQRNHRYFSKHNQKWYIQNFRCLLGFCNTAQWMYEVIRLAQHLGIQHGKIGFITRLDKIRRTMPLMKVYFTPRSYIRAGMFFFGARKQGRLQEIAEHYGLRATSETIRTALWVKGNEDIVRSE